jgi:hypothetical protein
MKLKVKRKVPAPGWGVLGPPPRAGLHIERVVDRLTKQDVIGSIRHPSHAWCAPVPRPGDEAALRALALAYLEDVAKAAKLRAGDPRWLHPELWQRLRQARQRRDGFRWLPCSWSGPRDASTLPKGVGPLGSILIQRVDGADVMVLLAGHASTEHQLQFGADIGIRMVIHLANDLARIYGVTLSNVSSSAALQAVPPQIDMLLQEGGLRPIKQAVAATLVGGPVDDGQPSSGAVWLNNIERSRQRGAPPNRYCVSGLAAQVKNPYRKLERSRIHDFRVEVDVKIDDRVRQARVVHVHRNDYIGSAADAWTWRDLEAFTMDGASQGKAKEISKRRPSRSPLELEELRSPVRLFTNWYQSASPELRIDNPRPWFETRTAEARNEAGAPPPTVPTGRFGAVALPDMPADGPPVLSDAQASIETHLRATELFFRLQAYGFDPEAYFRFARLPLVQRARPAMTWAPDGDLPNAEVRPFIGGTRAQARLWNRVQLLVRYGSASPFHREKQPVVADSAREPGDEDHWNRRKAQYLSVACDPRWAWHEFGHVLAYAGTGELELPFAHGVGDGLAAIVADPASQLAVEADAPARFVTFPWIEVPGRSHGRQARREGYCWCGARNMVRLDFDAPVERYHHSYFGEQLMSSSLFRLYRSLGGDTRSPHMPDDAADLKVRMEASDYCVYLVMYALSLLGADSVAPAQTPDQFVAALIDADLATGDWRVRALWPFNAAGGAREMERHGGLVHKVVRWAFERQGLYATRRPRKTVEGPGRPPVVDVYIEDRRPLQTGLDADPGGYSPVPLRLDESDASGSLWLAAREAMVLNGGWLTITVRNRGRLRAADVSVRAWVRYAFGEPWTPLDAEAPLAQDCAPRGGHAVFRFRLVPADWREALWVLASADAPADPSNLGPGVLPPTEPAALRDLVAHDNNLALARLK